MDTQPSIPQPNVLPQTPVQSIPSQPPPKRSPIVTIFLILFVVILIAAGGYYLGSTNVLFPQPVASPVTYTAPTPEAMMKNEMSDWENYQNSEYNYSVRYPSNWIANEFTDDRSGIEIMSDAVRSEVISFTVRSIPLYVADASRFDVQLNGYSAVRWGDSKNSQYEIGLKNNKYLVITRYSSIEGNTLDQILSTFRFTDETVDTSGWKTYTNSNPGYIIKYPEIWQIDISRATLIENQGAELKFKNGEYELIISWPDVFGPDGCKFSDHPEFGKGPELPPDCPGEFKEFTSPTYVFRRLTTPSAIEGSGSHPWPVYTKDANSNVFVTVPPITYLVPLDYDQNIINEMDQILSTFKFLQ